MPIIKRGGKTIHLPYGKASRGGVAKGLGAVSAGEVSKIKRAFPKPRIAKRAIQMTSDGVMPRRVRR